MRTPQELDRLREQAVQLRRQGKSLRQIKSILGPIGNGTLNVALKGEPPPEWTRRPNAKDDLRARARELRTLGMDYDAIAAALGVAKSSVSLWVRDLPIPAGLSLAGRMERSAESTRRYWALERPAREAQRAATRRAAATELGHLTKRELLIAGAIAYWCEGSKSKPYRRTNRVNFINSDPSLICLFLQFLDAAGTPRSDLTFRVCIHESADVDAAQTYGARVTGASPGQFRRPTLKRHNPRTHRKNVGEDYHGCLRIDVRCSAALYLRIEGWAATAMAGMAPATGYSQPRLRRTLPMAPDAAWPVS